MAHRKKILAKILLILTVITIFLYQIEQPGDYDLGWHLRYGKDVLSDGVIWRANTYSSTMPGYRWINSSWGFDVIRYVLFTIGGFPLFSFLGALLPTLNKFLFFRAAGARIWEIILLYPLATYLLYPLNYHSFRGQQVSHTFTGLLYLWSWHFSQGKLFILYWAIPLFLIWANLHGQVILSFGMFALWCISRIVVTFIHSPQRARTELPHLLIPLAGSGLATLATPFGINLYSEVFGHAGNPAVRAISEFAPITPGSYFFSQLVVCGIVSMAAFFLSWRKHRLSQDLPYFAVAFFLYPVSFFQGRYFWTLILATIPLLVPLVRLLRPPNPTIRVTILGFWVFSLILYTVLAKLPHTKFLSLSWKTYCETLGCSNEGASILERHLSNARIYTDYNLGGWLIWNYPGIKPVIDGRMSLWHEENGFSPFLQIYYPMEQSLLDPETSPFDAFFILNSRPLNMRLQQLVFEKKTWRILFRDATTTIYVRNRVKI